MKESVEDQVNQSFRSVVNLAPARRIDGSKLWLDIHNRKHEYGPYLSEPIVVELERGGRNLKIWIPRTLRNSHRIEIQAVAEEGDLVFLLASHSLRPSEYKDDGRGILVVARKQADGSHAAVIWHEFFPQTLELLGLHKPRIDSLTPAGA